jgi:rhombotail lipoprotein
MRIRNNCLIGLLVVPLSALMAGCGYMTTNRSSSVVQYLYPDKKGYVETSDIPRLELPLRVGIAYVPADTVTGRSLFIPEKVVNGQALTERDKMELMAEVSEHFKKYDFVKSIELIPSAYLTAGGSFTNLDQIRSMFGVDVITLLSYDQTQFTDEGVASITYWTLIGAYIVPGEKNDTHTMVDASVYDIQSRKMLFRAPGKSHLKSKATPINLSEQLRRDSLESFKQASGDLVANLELQLELFRKKVQETPSEYQVVTAPGYTGGGSLDGMYIIILSMLGGYGIWLKKNHRAA